IVIVFLFFFFFQAEDGIRDGRVTGVQTCALPISHPGEPGYDPTYTLPCAKVLGEFRQRRKAFRPPSAVNISGMSFGALSGPAVEDRKSTRLNSSHPSISYAVFCLKKKKKNKNTST